MAMETVLMESLQGETGVGTGESSVGVQRGSPGLKEQGD